MGLRHFLQGAAAAICLAAIFVFAVAGSMLGTDDATTTPPETSTEDAPAVSVDAVLTPEAGETKTLDEADETEPDKSADGVAPSAAKP